MAARQWVVEDCPGGVHCIPEDDLIWHDTSPHCTCAPRVELVDAHLCGSPYQFVRRFYNHHAMDGRD